MVGWRGTFLVMGAIGIAALAVLMRLKDDPPELAHRPTLWGNLGALIAVHRAKPRVLWATLSIILAHCHTATSPFVQLWLVEDKGLDPARAQTLYGLMFVTVGLAGTFGAGLLGDWAHSRLGWDRARTAFLILVMLGPLLPLDRLTDASGPLFIVGMTCSILSMTALYGLVFAVVEEMLPPQLKATSTGLTMLLINVFAIGAISMGVGMASDHLSATGTALSWTYPLMGADTLSRPAIPSIYLAVRCAR